MAQIRLAKLEDAQAIAQLMVQLGYASNPELISGKLKLLAANPLDCVFVALQGESLVGVMSVHALELFHAPGRLGRITALVIDSAHRQQGIGKLLFQRAEQFFIQTNCVRVEVTSGNHRPGAHAFYQALGFQIDERRFIKHLHSLSNQKEKT